MNKFVTLNKKKVPCEDVLKIETVMVSNTLFSEITYRLFEPCYHEIKTHVPRDKGYKIELAVRKANQH